MHPIFPARAHRLTVLGSTRKRAATCPGVRNSSLLPRLVVAASSCTATSTASMAVTLTAFPASGSMPTVATTPLRCQNAARTLISGHSDHHWPTDWAFPAVDGPSSTLRTLITTEHAHNASMVVSATGAPLSSTQNGVLVLTQTNKPTRYTSSTTDM